MTIKEFIEAAIEGGFPFGGIKKERVTRIDTDSAFIDGLFYIHFFDHESDMYPFNAYQLLLNPEAWKAVGKIKGWGSFYDEEGMPARVGKWFPDTKDFASGTDGMMWQCYMVGMVEALIGGKTLEEYIALL